MSSTALADVIYERHRQDDKWGEQNITDLQWLAVLGEEFGEVAREVCELAVPPIALRDPSLAKLRAELIQVAAVAVNWVECLDRNVDPVLLEKAS